MGYLTRFTLTLPEHLTQAQVDFIFNTDCIEKTPLSSVFYGGGNSRHSERIKWYSEEYEDEFIRMSRLYPEILFTLDGVGEEPDDVWRMFFKNGLYERHKMPVWDPPTIPNTFS